MEIHIDLKALKGNYEAIHRHVKKYAHRLSVVLKEEYTTPQIVAALSDVGATDFSVTSLKAAKMLPKQPTVSVNYISLVDSKNASQVTNATASSIVSMEEHMAFLIKGIRPNQRFGVWVVVDFGESREGVAPDLFCAFFKSIKSKFSKNIHFEGILVNFGCLSKERFGASDISTLNELRTEARKIFGGEYPKLSIGGTSVIANLDVIASQTEINEVRVGEGICNGSIPRNEFMFNGVKRVISLRGKVLEVQSRKHEQGWQEQYIVDIGKICCVAGDFEVPGYHVGQLSTGYCTLFRMPNTPARSLGEHIEINVGYDSMIRVLGGKRRASQLCYH